MTLCLLDPPRSFAVRGPVAWPFEAAVPICSVSKARMRPSCMTRR